MHKLFLFEIKLKKLPLLKKYLKRKPHKYPLITERILNWNLNFFCLRFVSEVTFKITRTLVLIRGVVWLQCVPATKLWLPPLCSYCRNFIIVPLVTCNLISISHQPFCGYKKVKSTCGLRLPFVTFFIKLSRSTKVNLLTKQSRLLRCFPWFKENIFCRDKDEIV